METTSAKSVCINWLDCLFHVKESYFNGYFINKLYDKKLSSGVNAGKKLSEVLVYCYFDSFEAVKGYKVASAKKFSKSVFEALRYGFFGELIKSL